MLANSLLIRFSSSSRARAFLRSAIKDTSPAQACQPPWSIACVESRIPRIVGTLPVCSRLNKPPPALAAILEVTEAAMLVVVVVVVGGRFPPGR